MAELTLVEAVNLALHHEMEHDPNVIVLGEDVGDNGGVFRATVGLKQNTALSALSTRHWPKHLLAVSLSGWQRKA